MAVDGKSSFEQIIQGELDVAAQAQKVLLVGADGQAMPTLTVTTSSGGLARIQEPVLVTGSNIQASSGSRYLVATTSGAVKQLHIFDTTGLYLDWYNASTLGTKLFTTGPGMDGPIGIAIASSTALYVISAETSGSDATSFVAINFLG